MTKKLISMLLSIAMVLSVAVVGISGVYAAIDSDGRYVPSEGTATNRLYFVMPESWKNEKFGADSAGIFWWNGSDACVSNGGSSQAVPWPGYKMQVYDADANIFYIDIPSVVPAIIFNNCLNGGEREEDAETGKVTFEFGEEQFKAAMQTKDVCCQYYSAGDDDYYDNMLDGEFWNKAQEAFEGNDKTFLGNFKDNFFIDTDFDLGISMTFDNMIFVIDPENYDVNELSGRVSYGGEFYFLYGKNADGKYEYGGLPNYEMAKENGVVSVLDKSVFPNPTVQPTDPFDGMIYGDVNNDGMITIVDATIVQKYIVNVAQLDNVNQKLADVDVDGVITVKDATAVQKYIVDVDGYGKTGEKFAAA